MHLIIITPSSLLRKYINLALNIGNNTRKLEISVITHVHEEIAINYHFTYHSGSVSINIRTNGNTYNSLYEWFNNRINISIVGLYFIIIIVLCDYV